MRDNPGRQPLSETVAGGHARREPHALLPQDPIVTLSNQPGTLEVLLPTDKELVLKVIPMPADCNANGDIFGGWVMAQVDLAGAVLPARHTQGRQVTVAVNQFIFKQPVRVGDILSFFASVTRIGRTSVTVQVEVYAEQFRTQGKYVKVTEASLTYVAIDADGKPREIAHITTPG